MRKTILLLLISLNVACGSENFPGERVMDEQFNQFVLEFNEDYQTHLGEEQFKTVKMYFDTEGVLAANSQAGCEAESGEVIFVNEEWWGYASDSYKKSVIYHELGHCVLGLEHSDNSNDIMYRALNSSFVLTMERIANLFLGE